MQSKEKTIELLNEISQNTDMGRATITELIDETQDNQLRSHLQKELETYEDIGKRAAGMLGVEGETPKQQSPMAKAGAKIQIKAKTLMNKSPKHIAEMLCEGCEMGVKNMQKAIDRCEAEANPGAVALAQRLMHEESVYEGELRQFL